MTSARWLIYPPVVWDEKVSRLTDAERYEFSRWLMPGLFDLEEESEVLPE